MAKTTFTAKELEEAIEGLSSVDNSFPGYPLILRLSYSGMWDEGFFPKTFRKIGNDEDVVVCQEEYFGGEEGGDHSMYIILRVGWGSDARYFKKTGLYDSWDVSEWDGQLYEVVPEEVKKTEWVVK